MKRDARKKAKRAILVWVAINILFAGASEIRIRLEKRPKFREPQIVKIVERKEIYVSTTGEELIVEIGRVPKRNPYSDFLCQEMEGNATERKLAIITNAIGENGLDPLLILAIADPDDRAVVLGLEGREFATNVRQIVQYFIAKEKDCKGDRLAMLLRHVWSDRVDTVHPTRRAIERLEPILNRYRKLLENGDLSDSWFSEVRGQITKRAKKFPAASPDLKTSWGRGIENRWQEYMPAIELIAPLYYQDPRFIAAKAAAESSFLSESMSEDLALGLLQLTPVGAKQVGMEWEKLKDPLLNIIAGCRYSEWLAKNTKNWDQFLAAYNAGIKRVQDCGGVPDFPETRNHIPKVYGWYNFFTQKQTEIVDIQTASQ